MAYAATAGNFPASTTAPPGVLALQRALVWLVGASGAVVFIEPSPYEITTLAAIVVFFATGLRLRLVFMPLLLLLFLINVGYTIGAVVAALAGIAGYFNLIPGGHDLLTLYARARGTFKDPNVLGAFLILPALFSLQSVVSDKLGKACRNVIAFGIMSLAILLAFSRAAWGGLVLTSAFMLALMVLTSRTNAQRSRIIIMAIVAVVLGLA